MQNNSYMYSQNDIERLIDEKLASKSKSTVWYNPISNTFWKTFNVGWQPTDPAIDSPPYDIFLANGSALGMGLGALKGASASAAATTTTAAAADSSSSSPLSSTEIDTYRYMGIAPEFLDEANRFWSDIDRARKRYYSTGLPLGAGVITTQSYPNIANVMVEASMIELAPRDFILEQAVTRRTTDKLVYTADNYVPYLNEPDIGENDLIGPRTISYNRFQITLKKAQGHVKASRWAEMAIRDHNIIEDNFRIIDADFPRIFAKEIATTLAGFTNQAASGPYDTIAVGAYHSTTNPTVRFDADSLSIRNAGGSANRLAMNSKTYRVLIQNTWMRVSSGSIFGDIPEFQNARARVVTHPLLPGYTIFIDEELPNGSIFQYDVRGIEFIQGPMRSITVDEQAQNMVSQIVDKWYGSGLRVSGFGVEQTGTVT